MVPSAGSYRQSLSGCTTQVTEACMVSVRFTQPVAGGVGLAAGKSFTVTVTLKAPQELTPAWPSNGRAVTNTAIGTSSSIAASVSSSAEVTVDIPDAIALAVGKTWTPAEQQHRPGEVSTIALSAQNTSNVPAGTLVLQEPQTAADGAGALDAANPFALVDFAGFGDITLPQGATTVRVDAYVRDAGTGQWSWQAGAPTTADSVQLPPGVAAAEIAGLRIAFTGEDGAALAPGGSAGSVALSVAQRATDRVSGAALVGGARVTNRIEGTVSVAGQPPATATATAPFAVGALDIAVTPGKTIVPARIPAGGTALATVSGKNASNGPLDTLRLSDLGYFGDKLAFGGFAAGVSYPQGATSGSMVWHFSDGSTESAPFTDGAVPSLPTVPEGQRLTGVEAVFAGGIEAGAVAEAGAPGSYGEAARSVSEAEIRIAGGAVGGAVPPAQSVTVTNTYEYGRLALAKTASTSIAGRNEDVTYTITVGNVGVLDATDFEVADTLPPGAVFVSADGDGVFEDGVVTWTVAQLAPGDRLDLQVVLRHPQEGSVVNAVTVTTPPVGPWQPPLVDTPCDDDPDAACSPVFVVPPGAQLLPEPDPDLDTGLGPDTTAAPGAVAAVSGLASTGSTQGGLLLAVLPGLLVLLGSSLVLRHRRRRP
ncbi:hypothetical protein O159_03940 [Leifsonia xyli subsp. cynodontis DSM 46306]|uniref:DUF11 domain-containing protein n=1 Tax=Leifsonia xyli subsp. cynodontis DSM 46306 TaxID=1389489 RepID=U3PAS9_LEIXC|nr:DUF11 domain-containing protein [Leifsonia xyli]AGW40603.1 hypothetical protein O159_03940 [Leifsonia xyli subsp. cynodontis DSM 46306]